MDKIGIHKLAKKLTVRSKILGTCTGASMTLRRGTSLDVI